jgi:hypothetical protein
LPTLVNNSDCLTSLQEFLLVYDQHGISEDDEGLHNPVSEIQTKSIMRVLDEDEQIKEEEESDDGLF